MLWQVNTGSADCPRQTRIAADQNADIPGPTSANQRYSQVMTSRRIHFIVTENNCRAFWQGQGGGHGIRHTLRIAHGDQGRQPPAVASPTGGGQGRSLTA
jgi:hypothetical protein